MSILWYIAVAAAGPAERVDRLVEKGELEKALKVCEKADAEANESCGAAQLAWLRQTDPEAENLAAWQAMWTQFAGTVAADAAREEVAALKISTAAVADLPRVIAEWKGTRAATVAVDAEFQRAEQTGKSDSLYRFLKSYPDAPQGGAALGSAEALAWSEAEAQGSVQAWNALVKLSPAHPRAKEAEARIDVLERAQFLAKMKVLVDDSDGAHPLAEGTALELHGPATVRVKGNSDAALSYGVREGGKELGPEAIPAALTAAGFPAGLLPSAPTWTSGDPRTLTLGSTWCRSTPDSQTFIRVTQGEWTVEYLVVPAALCADLAKTAKPEGSVVVAGKPLSFGSSKADAAKRLPSLTPGLQGTDWTKDLGVDGASGEWSTLSADDVSLLYFRDLLVAADFNCGGDACYDDKSAYTRGRSAGTEEYRLLADAETTEVWSRKGTVIAHDRQWMSNESGDPFFSVRIFESRMAALAGARPAQIPTPQVPAPTGASPTEIWSLVSSFKSAAASKDPRRLVPLLSFPAAVEGTNYATADALLAQLGTPELYDNFVIADLKNYRSVQDIQVGQSPSGSTMVTLVVPAGGCQTVLVLSKVGSQLKIVSISVGTWE